MEVLGGLPELTMLVLDHKQVTSHGIGKLCALKKLQSISLVNTTVEDEAAGVLASLLELTTLNLNRTRVTDAVIPKLARLPKLESLRVAARRYRIAAPRRS